MGIVDYIAFYIWEWTSEALNHSRLIKSPPSFGDISASRVVKENEMDVSEWRAIIWSSFYPISVLLQELALPLIIGQYIIIFYGERNSELLAYRNVNYFKVCALQV